MSIYRLLLLMTLNLFQVEMCIAQLKPVRRIIRCERRKICHLTDNTHELPRRVREEVKKIKNATCPAGLDRRIKNIKAICPAGLDKRIKKILSAICPAGLEKNNFPFF